MSDPGEPWDTRISDADANHLWIRGHDVIHLMKAASFTDVMYLLHHERLPTPAERRILDAILIGVADHGPGSPSAAAARLVASGSRQAPEAAIAAGVLAIGDVHGGACMAALQWIGAVLKEAEDRGATAAEAAADAVRDATAQGRRIAGFGHRVHRTADPRSETLIGLAREHGVLGEGVSFMLAVERELEAQVKRLPMNIDGVLAAVLYDIGWSPLFSKCLFIIGRAAGLSAQVAEEYEYERPMRIRIPVRYVGREAEGTESGTSAGPL